MKDGDVKLPAQVQKQEDEANRLWEEHHGKTGDKGDLIPEPAPEPAPEPVVEEPEPEPSPEPEPEPEPAPEPTPEPEPIAVDIQHKFDVLQGKYDAEVPRLSAENKQLRDHSLELGTIIGTLQKEVEKLKVEQPSKEQPVVDNSQIVQQLLDEEEMDELREVVSPELLAKVVDGIVKSRMQPIEQSLGSVRDTQFKTAEDVFWDKVNVIPNLSTINTDQGFNQWLNQKAPYTHRTRRQILTEAQERLDAPTVVELFTDFSAINGPAPTPDPAPTPATSGKRKAHISPAKGAGSGTNVPAQGKIWTVTEINTFYQDVSKGKYRGKDKDRKQKEQDIWNAQKDGRIRRT